jgi:hypothetical protein
MFMMVTSCLVYYQVTIDVIDSATALYKTDLCGRGEPFDEALGLGCAQISRIWPSLWMEEVGEEEEHKIQTTNTHTPTQYKLIRSLGWLDQANIINSWRDP